MRLRLVFAPAILLLVLVGASRSQTGERKKFEHAEGKFEILLPDRPKVLKKGKVVTVVWEKDDDAIGVSFGDLPVIADKNPARREAMLAEMSETAAKSLKAEIGQRRKIAILGNPGQEWTGAVRDSKNEALVRTYLVGPRFYQIVVLGRAEFVRSEETKKALDSFRLVK